MSGGGRSKLVLGYDSLEFPLWYYSSNGLAVVLVFGSTHRHDDSDTSFLFTSGFPISPSTPPPPLPSERPINSFLPISPSQTPRTNISHPLPCSTSSSKTIVIFHHLPPILKNPLSGTTPPLPPLPIKHHTPNPHLEYHSLPKSYDHDLHNPHFRDRSSTKSARRDPNGGYPSSRHTTSFIPFSNRSTDPSPSSKSARRDTRSLTYRSRLYPPSSEGFVPKTQLDPSEERYASGLSCSGSGCTRWTKRGSFEEADEGCRIRIQEEELGRWWPERGL